MNSSNEWLEALKNEWLNATRVADAAHSATFKFSSPQCDSTQDVGIDRRRRRRRRRRGRRALWLCVCACAMRRNGRRESRRGLLIRAREVGVRARTSGQQSAGASSGQRANTSRGPPRRRVCVPPGARRRAGGRRM